MAFRATFLAALVRTRNVLALTLALATVFFSAALLTGSTPTAACDPCDLNGDCWDPCTCDPNHPQCANPCGANPCFSTLCIGYPGADVCACRAGGCVCEECPGNCPDGACETCGDGICNNGETYESCPEDCDDPCGNGTCDNGETCASCPDDCTYNPCAKGECFNLEECCERNKCSDLSCPGYCDDPICGDEGPDGYCCQQNPDREGCGGDCGGKPYPDDGKSYTCCGDVWYDSTKGECCPDDRWCDNSTNNRCIGRNICFADRCVEDGEYKCAVAITHECTVGRDYQCQNYCEEHPDDPCCIDPALCDICGNGVCDEGECDTCEIDCSPQKCACGNGVCDEGECETCPSDCAGGDLMYCGDGTCSGDETDAGCPSDCPEGNPGSAYGCTDSTACNFDSGASLSNGSCTYPGCIDPESPNYDPSAGCLGSCDGPEGNICSLMGSYSATVECLGIGSRSYSGLAECSAAMQGADCPCNEYALAAFASDGIPSLCSGVTGTPFYGGSGSYSFRYIIEETCPAGQIRVDGGCAQSCPEGDADGDGLCDCAGSWQCGTCDPCVDVDDPVISTDAARAAAGLREPDAFGQCCVGGECCATPGYVFMPDEHMCRPVTDLCDNIAGDQTQAWLDSHPDFTRVSDGAGGWNCLCGPGMQVCGETCIPNTQCCDPVNFWYCPCLNRCIPNSEYCGAGVGCGCRPGLVECPVAGGTQCLPADQCVVGCFEAGGPVGEYCTEIIGTGGAVNEPWATAYPSATALNAFFGQRPGLDSEGNPHQTLLQASSSRSAGCDDSNPATPCYPVFGRVPVAGQNGQCDAQVCDYGQECALYVRAGGVTSAVCVDAKCDPCDTSLPPVPPGGPVAGECYYDPDALFEDQCPCNPTNLLCCEADPSKPTYSPQCLLTPRGLAIEVLPNLINQGDSCFVLWASQGMASTTLVGDGISASVRHLRAGVTEVEDVQVSTLYKILGTGVDGQTYEASDLCATNPNIREF